MNRTVLLAAFLAVAWSGCDYGDDVGCLGGAVPVHRVCMCPKELPTRVDGQCVNLNAGTDGAAATALPNVEAGTDAGSDAGRLDIADATLPGLGAVEDAQLQDSGSEPVESGMPAPPPDPLRRSIGVGEGFACALRASGQPVCWGSGLGRAGGAPVVRLSALSVGTNHACGVRPDGHVQCWGGNQAGQASPPPNVGFTQVAAGHDHTCGLQSDGLVVCWGANDSGQASPPSQAFSSIVAGHAFTCGLSSAGLVSCWGWGDGRTDAPSTVAFASIALGGIGGCGIRSDDQRVQCWQGGTPTASLKPPDGAFAHITYGATFLCGIRPNGHVECWGDARVSSPADTYKEVATSATQLFACGLTTTDRVACWGDEAVVLPLAPE